MVPESDKQPAASRQQHEAEVRLLGLRFSSLRWFAAELAVVVAGILIAFALQAWWQGRSDRTEEQAYLARLEADLRNSIVQLEGQLVIQLDGERAAVALQRAALSTDPPPEATLAGFVIDLNYYSDPQPNYATARSLVESGDLSLIQDAALREAIVRLVDRAAYLDKELAMWHQQYVQSLYELDAQASFPGLVAKHGFTPRLAALTSSRAWLPPEGERRTDPAISVTALLEDPGFRHAVFMVRLGSSVLRSMQQQQLGDVRALLQRVEAATPRQVSVPP